MSKDEALKLALEALKGGLWDYGPGQDEHQKCEEVIAICEKALTNSALERMAENARELGLDYEPIVEQVEDSVGMGYKAWDMVDPKELAKEFHKALADPPCKTGSQCTSKCQQCEQPEAELKATERQVEILSDELSKCSKELAALKAQHQEPVAWVCYGATVNHHDIDFDQNEIDAIPLGTMLYTSPPASKPLTDEQIGMAFRKAFPVGSVVFTNGAIEFARAIEAAHQIGVEK